MSRLLADVLRTLRVFGPCSNAEIARRLRLPLHTTYGAIKRLVDQGLAVHPKLQRWDVSEEGRRHFARKPMKELTLYVEVGSCP